MRLCLDHHYPRVLADRLVDLGYDVITAHQRGWHTLEDEDLLAACTAEDRALLTNNAKDFMPIVTSWPAQGRPHHGVILTDDARWPRVADTTGKFLDALIPLLRGDDLTDRIHWL
ncbi:hypothetical protein BH24ACT15_BH24ACT15_28650 [soil metagenome]